MSFISGTVGAVMASESQDEATRANKRNVRQTNITNMILQLIARGAPLRFNAKGNLILPTDLAGSSSAILPYYFGDTETDLSVSASDVSEAIRSIYPNPTAEIADYTRLLDSFAPAAQQNNRLATDIASGEVGRQMMEESEPVFQARTDAANVKKNASLEALRETLNEIDAIQGKKGFVGDSFGNRLLKFNARRRVAAEGAIDLSQANLQNALDRRTVAGDARTLRLSNINLPGQMAESNIRLLQLPSTMASTRFQTSLQPFDFFKMGGGQFTPFNTPIQGAVPSPWQGAATAGAAFGNTMLNYSLQRDLASRSAAPTTSAGQWNTGYESTGPDWSAIGGAGVSGGEGG